MIKQVTPYITLNTHYRQATGLSAMTALTNYREGAAVAAGLSEEDKTVEDMLNEFGVLKIEDRTFHLDVPSEFKPVVDALNQYEQETGRSFKGPFEMDYDRRSEVHQEIGLKNVTTSLCKFFEDATTMTEEDIEMWLERNKAGDYGEANEIVENSEIVRKVGPDWSPSKMKNKFRGEA